MAEKNTLSKKARAAHHPVWSGREQEQLKRAPAPDSDLARLFADRSRGRPTPRQVLQMQRLGGNRARQLWADDLPQQAGRGWSICPLDPAQILPAFPRLFIKPGLSLRAYQYRWGRDGHTQVFALPQGAELPPLDPDEDEPPVPAAALPEVMDAVGGGGLAYNLPLHPRRSYLPLVRSRD